MALIDCPNCHRVNRPDASACLYCGHSLRPAAHVEVVPDASLALGREPTPEELDQSAWTLRRGDKTFGPMTGRELRGYFTSKMVVAGDTVFGPGWTAPVSAIEAARLLQVPAPKPTIAPPIMVAHTHHLYVQEATGSGGRGPWGIVGVLVLLVVLLLSARAFLQTAVKNSQPKTLTTASTIAKPTSPDQTADSPSSGPEDEGPVAVRITGASDTGRRDWIKSARELARAQNWQGLVDESQHWIDAQPEDAAAWGFRGMAYAALGDNGQAMEAEKRAVELAPGDAMAWNNLANCQLIAGDLPGVEASARKAVELDGRLATAWNNLGVALQGQGKQDEALAAYQRAVAAKPDYAIALTNVGDQLVHRQKYPEAIDAYQKAVAASPDYQAAVTGLANAKQMQASGAK